MLLLIALAVLALCVLFALPFLGLAALTEWIISRADPHEL
jgi:Tfp pilus assembly protein FimT